LTRWQRTVAAIWAVGLAIRLWDVFGYRPTCAPGSSIGVLGASCYTLKGDAAGFFGAAHLVRLGEVGMNPLLYNVSGGRLVATASKPPLGVAWLALVGWLGDSPWLGQTIVSVLLVGVIALTVRHSGAEPER